MKTNKILVVEDEMIIAANISLQLTTLGYELTAIIPRGDEVMYHVRHNPPDIILLDINLNSDLDGVDVAHMLQKEYNIPIIYLTASTDEVNFNRAKATNPYAFISKPFKKRDLSRAIELTVQRIFAERLLERKPQIYEAPYILSDCIFVRRQDKIIKVPTNEILYIEAERNYCKIHCHDKTHLLVTTLKDLEEKMAAKHFLRIHRSFIVNISHIDEIATSHVVIAKKAIPLSADLRKQLLLHIPKV